MSVLRVQRSELAPGALLERFRAGAAAVVLEGDGRVREIWNSLVGPAAGDAAPVSNEILPWDGSVIDLFDNFHTERGLPEEIGDVVYGSQGFLTYIARKISLSMEPQSAGLTCRPSHFSAAGSRRPVDTRSLEPVWELAVDIMRGLGLSADGHSVDMHRLRYQSNLTGLDRQIGLLCKATGRPANGESLLHRLGRSTPDASTRVLRWAKRSPRLRRLLARAPAPLLQTLGLSMTPDGTVIAGEAHIDGRIFSALAALRSNVVTEAWYGGAWHPLPLGPDSLAIIPGKKAGQLLGLRPTWHRVLLRVDPATEARAQTPELSLLLGAK